MTPAEPFSLKTPRPFAVLMSSHLAARSRNVRSSHLAAAQRKCRFFGGLGSAVSASRTEQDHSRQTGTEGDIRAAPAPR